MRNEVRNFLAHIKRTGLMTDNRFRVTIPLPDAVAKAISGKEDDSFIPKQVKDGIRLITIAAGGDVPATRGLQVMCAATELAGMNVTTADVRTSSSFKVVTGTSHDDINFEFLMSGDMKEKKTLDIWRNVMRDQNTRKVGYYDDYTVDIQIDVLNTYDQVTYSMTLQGAFPVLFNAMSLDKRRTSGMLAYSLNFSYRKAVDGTVEEGSGLTGRVGSIVDDVLAGDLENATASTRELIIDTQNGKYNGLANDIYHNIANLSKNVTGLPTSDINGMLLAFKPEIASNDLLSNDDKTGLSGLVDSLIK